jgi:pimeloyl-ACP methyl ester carboxylesterase
MGAKGGTAGVWPVRLATAILATLLVAGCGSGDGLGALAASAGSAPGHQVRLPDGRTINLRCSGRGSPAVILESGHGADSAAWSRVQPKLARATRTCAYDRAGSGFSDPGPLPRDGAAIARDLDLALQAAGVRGPFVVVGHSAGGLYARLFAARRPGDVVGLVLADPTVERRAPTSGQDDGLDGVRRRLQRCLAATAAAPPPAAADPQWAGCGPPKGDDHARAIARRPDTWRARLSELDTLFGRTSEQVFRIGTVLQDVPAYVLTASDTAASAGTYGFDKPQSIWVLQHQEIASRFRAGSQRTVFSSHLMMNDRPEVIVDAALEMVRAAQDKRLPAPLAPSETADEPAPEASPFAGATILDLAPPNRGATK